MKTSDAETPLDFHTLEYPESRKEFSHIPRDLGQGQGKGASVFSGLLQTLEARHQGESLCQACFAYSAPEEVAWSDAGR